MSDQPPIFQGRPAGDEQRRLVALFSEMETKQLDFLDAAGKSIIERTAAMLAVLFAVTAFGNDFPPPYLKGNMGAKYLLIGILLLYLGAMFLGMRTVQPRDYSLYRSNVTGMKAEFGRIISNKSRSLWLAGILFWLGSLLLALLIGAIIFSA